MLRCLFFCWNLNSGRFAVHVHSCHNSKIKSKAQIRRPINLLLPDLSKGVDFVYGTLISGLQKWKRQCSANVFDLRPVNECSQPSETVLYELLESNILLVRFVESHIVVIKARDVKSAERLQNAWSVFSITETSQQAISRTVGSLIFGNWVNCFSRGVNFSIQS